MSETLKREVLLSFGEPDATFRLELWDLGEGLPLRMALCFLCEGEAERVVTLSPKYARQVASLLSAYSALFGLYEKLLAEHKEAEKPWENL